MYKVVLTFVDEDKPREFMALYPPVFSSGLVTFQTEETITTIPTIHVTQIDVIEIAPANKMAVDEEADKPIDFKPETHFPQ